MKLLSNPPHFLVGNIYYRIFSLLVFLTLPLIATLKGKGIVISVIVFSFLNLKAFCSNRNEAFQRVKTPLGMAVCSLVFLSLLSASWSENALRSFGNATCYSLMLLGGWVLFQGLSFQSKERQEIVRSSFWIGILIYAGFFFSEIYLSPLASKLYTHSVNINKELFIRGIVILGFLFWPFLLFLVKKYPQFRFWKIFLISWGLLLCILLRARPDSALAGALIGGILSLLVYRFSRFPFFFFFIFSTFTFLAPWVFSRLITPQVLGRFFNYLPSSYQHRVLIWNDMSAKIFEKTWMGHGFDHSSTLHGGNIMCLTFERITFDVGEMAFKVHPKIFNGCSYIFSSHPHNGIVQLWVELGLAGILCFLSILGALVWRISRKADPAERACLFGGLIFFQIIMLVGFGLWQTWIAAGIILMVSVFSVVMKLGKS